jgi:hypothetical protein
LASGTAPASHPKAGVEEGYLLGGSRRHQSLSIEGGLSREESLSYDGSRTDIGLAFDQQLAAMAAEGENITRDYPTNVHLSPAASGLPSVFRPLDPRESHTCFNMTVCRPCREAKQRKGTYDIDDRAHH